MYACIYFDFLFDCISPGMTGFGDNYLPQGSKNDVPACLWAPKFLLGHLKKDFVTKQRVRTDTFK